MDRSVFENKIIVVFAGQRFCVALSAWLDGKEIAKLVSAGDGRGGENLFAMGMQLPQKLELITGEVFFRRICATGNEEPSRCRTTTSQISTAGFCRITFSISNR